MSRLFRSFMLMVVFLFWSALLAQLTLWLLQSRFEYLQPVRKSLGTFTYIEYWAVFLVIFSAAFTATSLTVYGRLPRLWGPLKPAKRSPETEKNATG